MKAAHKFAGHGNMGRMRTRASIFLFGLAGVISIGVACNSGPSGGTAIVEPEGGSTVFSYSPAGCSYAVSPPATLALTDLALDDTTSVGDPTTAAPERVRLGLGGNYDFGKAGYADPTTTAAFTWETAGKNHAAKLKFGTDPNNLSQTQAGYVWTTPPPTQAIGANEPETYMHEVHVCGLTPGTTYYYQVGGGATGSEVWSATQSFTTVPSSGEITVGISGDARDQVSTFQLVQERMRDAAVNFQLFSGDIVDIGTEEMLYTQWLNSIWQDPADNTKFITLGQQYFVPIAGNHENEAARFYANFSIPGEGDYAESYASFGLGAAHVVMLDDQPVATQQGSDHATKELAWLDSDLSAANADRANHPFIIVVSHRGLFSTALHSNDSDVLAARAAFAPIYDKYHVDMVFNGHDHEYERSKPLKAGTSNPGGEPIVGSVPADGTTYVICAGAGADPYQAGQYNSDYRNGSATGFGGSTAYIGVYGILTIDSSKLSLKSYGLKSAGGSVSGDDVIDTYEIDH